MWPNFNTIYLIGHIKQLNGLYPVSTHPLSSFRSLNLIHTKKCKNKKEWRFLRWQQSCVLPTYKISSFKSEIVSLINTSCGGWILGSLSVLESVQMLCVLSQVTHLGEISSQDEPPSSPEAPSVALDLYLGQGSAGRPFCKAPSLQPRRGRLSVKEICFSLGTSQTTAACCQRSCWAVGICSTGTAASSSSCCSCTRSRSSILLQSSDISWCCSACTTQACDNGQLAQRSLVFNWTKNNRQSG